MQGGKLNLAQLEQKANDLRQSVIEMLVKAGSGHSAGSLGMADVFTALYFNLLNHRPDDPDWSQRDAVFLSNGHIAPILYAAMAHSGYFAVSELDTLRQLGSRLQGHPERTHLPGVEQTSGPLGEGLGQAAGFAYNLHFIDKNPHRFVYALLGDGELDEGNVWESAMFAGKYKLSQLIGIIDRNNIQIDGTTEDIMPLEDLRGKWESFGWHVQEIDGNNIQSVIDAVKMAKAITVKPSMIIAHTIPGKGVDFMEYDYKWHGIAPNDEQAKQALLRLRTLDGQISYEGEA